MEIYLGINVIGKERLVEQIKYRFVCTLHLMC